MKQHKIPALFILLVVYCQVATGQSSMLSLGLWNLTSATGELKLGGLYGNGYSDIYGLHNTTETYKLYGGLSLKTKSYIWNPGFMKIDIDGGYFPQTNKNQYLIFQNYMDVYNSKRFHFGTTFFDRKPITMNVYYNYDDGFDSRENLTDIRTNSQSEGGMLSEKYKFLPLSVSYNQNNWNSKELETGRYYTYLQKNWDGRITKSFGKRDRTEIIYTKHDYTLTNYNIAPSRSIFDNLECRNNYLLDSSKTSYLSSDIVGTSQTGVDSYKQFRLAENLVYKLPMNLKLNSGLSYVNTQRPGEGLEQTDFTSLLGHQLFSSLHSDILYEYIGTNESTYTETNNKGGADLAYTKKIPTSGMLNLSYSYSMMHEHKQSSDEVLQVSNEPYVLADNQVVMLKLPYIELSSIMVRDQSGTILYQQYLDYVLVETNNYIQIIRVPGGQIPNNATVYLYYSADQPGNIQYDLGASNLNASISLFNQLFSIYYSNYTQRYYNVVNTDASNLNYLNNNIYGTRVAYKAVTVGGEFNDYRSSLYPYKIIHFYAIIQGTLHNKFKYALNANSRDYLKLSTDSTRRLYEDVTGMLSYIFNPKTKFDVNLGYQYQNGMSIDLDMVTARFKLVRVIHSCTCTAGIDMYKRTYLIQQRSAYAGGYIQISKKF